MVHYDEAALAEMTRRGDSFYYQCPCGDEFVITLGALQSGKREAVCPTCSLVLLVVCTADEVAALRSEAQSHPAH